MRDKKFVATHRGGLLTPEDHRLLMRWAIKCCKRVITLTEDKVDGNLLVTISVAHDWEKGRVGVADAMKAARSAQRFARLYTTPVSMAVARSAAHVVATAHMADHCIIAALYALKAAVLSGRSVEKEQKWQLKQLEPFPESLRDLLILTLAQKLLTFKL